MTQPLPSVNIDEAVTEQGIQCSHGTAAIMNTIYQWSLNKNLPIINSVSINILTILRNVLNTFKDINRPQQILSRLATDIEQLIFYIDSYTSLFQVTLLPKAYIYVYIPDYTSIPQDIRKKATKADTLLIHTYNSIYRYISRYYPVVERAKPSLQPESSNRLDIFRFKCRDLPHRTIASIAQHYDHQFNYGDHYLISHIPADYHFLNIASKIKLLRSHTGAVVPAQQLGEVVFQHAEVPFNRYTHYLLGDRKVTRCLVDKQIKENVIEMAKKDRWLFKTQSYIMKKLILLNYYSYTMDKNNPY